MELNAEGKGKGICSRIILVVAVLQSVLTFKYGLCEANGTVAGSRGDLYLWVRDVDGARTSVTTTGCGR